MENITELLRYTDRDLIDFVLGSYYIIDYGFVKKVNDDKTVDVVHAKKTVKMNGEELQETETKHLEVLTFSTREFAVSFTPSKGDKVLLLALKNYVKQTKDVIQAKTPTTYIHYQRETMKCLPLAAFDSEAKIKIEAEKGTLKVTADKIELNGNSKSLVTYEDLNNALTSFLQLLNTHTHPVPGVTPGSGSTTSSTPTAQITIDISASKTGTIKTGG